MRKTKFNALLLSAFLTCRALAAPATAEDSPGGITPPSFQARDLLVINLRTKLQVDASGFDPQLDDHRNVFLRRRARFGADGTLFRELDYSVSVETGSGSPELRDLFFKYHPLPWFQIQAGRFKIPFGLDQLTDSSNLDFVKRSRGGSLLAPGRDVGTLILGEILDKKVFYSAGVFRHDGTNSEIQDFAAIDEYGPGGNRTVAARVTISPGDFLAAGSAFRKLKIGTAIARSSSVTGLSGLSGQTVSGQTFFPRMYVSGARLRRGAELSWKLEDLYIQSELIDVRDQRLGQGLRGEDLPSLRTQAWYVSATYPLLGYLRTMHQGSFLGSILPGRSIGLFEATARYEVIRFGGEPAPGSRPSRSPRAANVAGNEDRAWTFGINWHANPYLKFQVNGVRETLSDPVRTPIAGEHQYWTMLGRLQLAF